MVEYTGTELQFCTHYNVINQITSIKINLKKRKKSTGIVHFCLLIIILFLPEMLIEYLQVKINKSGKRDFLQ